MDKVFQIFKAGTHTDMQGRTMTWTRRDLEGMVASYPANGFAPLVLGHPRDNRPVYGHVKKLMVKNDGLYAHADVSEGLISAVRNKLYKHVSAAFHFPTATLPVWTLRHVGFLGAIGPGVRGMESLSFSDFRPDEGVAFAGECGLGDCLESIEFAAPDGFSVDPEALKTYTLIEEFRRACPGLGFIEAARLITTPY